MLKRVMIGIVALSCLLACYTVYVRVIHRITLSELDDPFKRNRRRDNLPSDDQRPDFARIVARTVFGPDSWQAKADIALYWLNKGTIIYIADYEKLGEQTLKLTPFSLVRADLSKPLTDTTAVVTLEGREATLEFDHPIDLVQMTSSKPVSGRVVGDVVVHSNRGTPDPADDIFGYTDYVEFSDTESRIWTEAPVRIVEQKSVMKGTAMEAHLTQPEGAAKSKATLGFGGVRDFTLLHNVQVNMVAAGGGMFGGAPQSASASNGKPRANKSRGAGAAGAPAKESPVQINCAGPFVYDLAESTARFSHDVELKHETGGGQFDHVFADELVALFESRKTPKGEPRDAASTDSELHFREAHAYGRTVRVVSDAQGTEAVGTELHHDVVAGVTLLKSDREVVASQGGNVIHAPVLKLGSTESGQRTMDAIGAGWLEVHEKGTGELSLKARWRDSMHVEPQDELQIVSLKGAVVAERPGQGVLSGERVKLWLAKRNGDAAAPVANAAAVGGIGLDSNGWMPMRIEAVSTVAAQSDQYDIHAAERLDIVFEDGPIPAQQIAASSKATKKNGNAANGANSGANGGAMVRKDKHNGANGAGGAAGKEPARLTARTVRVTALRDGPKTELGEMWADGAVDLWQPPDSAEGKPTIVRSDRLHVKRLELGNQMEAAGAPAHVEMQDLTVEGPLVGVDQPTSVAWVDGRGLMIMPSSSSLEGKKLDKPADVTIRWITSMFFDGGVAEFTGSVIAEQDQSSLRSERLEAYLAERIDIGNPKRKSQEPTKIEKIIATDAVDLTQITRVGERLDKLEHVEGKLLTYTASDGQMHVDGPGIYRSFGRGKGPLDAAQPGAAGAKPATAAGKAAAKQPKANKPEGEGKPEQLTMTEVRFDEKMDANRIQQIAKFHGHIAVIHSPVENETQRVDPNRLPDGGMELSCRDLEMGSKKGPDDTSYNEMIGTGDVSVGSRDFYGRSDRISYNQLLDRMILEANPGTFATLTRQKVQGHRPDEYRGRKIFYWRREDRIHAEESLQLDFTDVPAPGAKKEPAKVGAGTNSGGAGKR